MGAPWLRPDMQERIGRMSVEEITRFSKRFRQAPVFVHAAILSIQVPDLIGV